jgi:hypothetical protein
MPQPDVPSLVPNEPSIDNLTQPTGGFAQILLGGLGG